MPYTWGTTGLCYRSDVVKEAPDSWNDLLKPSDDLKGKTTMLSTDRWLMAAGFLANGMSVNTTDQASLDKVRDQLIETKRTLLPMTTRPSIRNWSRAKPISFRPGTAGATTASPRSRRSST